MSGPAVFFLLVIAPAFSLCLALLGLETLEENRLGWFLMALGISYPAGGVIYYFIHKKPFWEAASAGKAVKQEATDRSFWAIVPGFILVLFAPPAEWYYLEEFLPRSLAMEIVGWVLVAAGIILAGWARYSLWDYYSGRIQVGNSHTLVQNGPYRVIRHPAYAGMFLIGLGVALGYASWIGLLAILILLIPGLTYRIAVEDRLLSDRFGEEFGEYRKKTKAFIPGVW